MTINFSVRSHRGHIRECNEDNLCANGEILPPQAEKRAYSMEGTTYSPCLFSVCDGMGGTDRGELASFLTVRTIAERRERLLQADGALLKDEIAELVDAADGSIRKKCGKEASAGTTMSLAIISESDIRCFNIGDSRIYHLYKHELVQVTHDHTWMAEYMDKERPLRPESVLENMHKLTRCIGIGPPCQVETYPPLNKRGRLLLCSDGLTDMLSDSEIRLILLQNTEPETATAALLEQSLSKGGFDNITVILVDLIQERFSLF